METDSPPDHRPRAGGSGLRVSAWNLVLLIPLLMLITSWFNFDQPRLFGLPYFYWYQLAFVPVGVISVGLVYFTTRHLDNNGAARGHRAGPRQGDAPTDEGDQR